MAINGIRTVELLASADPVLAQAARFRGHEPVVETARPSFVNGIRGVVFGTASSGPGALIRLDSADPALAYAAARRGQEAVVVISSAGAVVPATAPWLLITTFWDDTGIWDDTATWVDANVTLQLCTYVGVNGAGALTGADGSGAGMRDGDEGSASSVWGSSVGNGSSLTAVLGGDMIVDHLELRCNNVATWGAVYTNGATVSYRPAAGGSWTVKGTISGVVINSALTFDMGGVAAGEIKIERSDNFLGIGDFKVYASP